MKVDIDARTLEAMRFLANARGVEHDGDLNVARVTVRAFLAAHDSARDAERDEALAWVIASAASDEAVNLGRAQYAVQYPVSWARRIEEARAARDFIAKEQVNTQQPRTETEHG